MFFAYTLDMITKKMLKSLKGSLFSRKDMSKLGFTGNDIQELLKSGQIVRLTHGIYNIPELDLSEVELFRASTMRIKGKSAVCLLSALSFYDLTDLIPKKVWLLVDEKKRTIHHDIRLFRSRNPYWKIGIIQDQGFAITSLERTLVDCLTLRRILGTNTAISAIKLAVSRKQTTLSKVIDMAVLLQVEHRIYPYIEGML